MASMSEKDYYAILEVDEQATTEQIRKAFQKKARTLHPDVNKEPDAEERFKEVSEAYAVLSDADKRKRYDAMRSGDPFAGAYGPSTGASPYGAGSPFDGFPFGSGWTRAQTRSSRTSRSFRPHAGADILFELDLDVETAKEGTQRGVTYQRYETCDACNGTGSVEHEHATTCPTCGGAGGINLDLGGFGFFGSVMEVPCPECEGSGKVILDPCAVCGGTGRTMGATEVVIEVPEGTHDGAEIRVEGMGNVGTNGCEAGDFVCKVTVAEEHLSNQQKGGFRLLGISIPIIVLGILSRPIAISAIVIGAVTCVLGLMTIGREGYRLNARWWAQGLRELGSGAVTGLAVVLILSLLLLSPLGSPLVFLALIFILPALMTRRPQ